jgi:hypothetical protein
MNKKSDVDRTPVHAIVMRTLMRSEVKPDCYDGETCDQIKNRFETYCEGDKDSDTHRDDLVIRVDELPPGAKVLVQYPCCPDCGLTRETLREFKDGCWPIVGHAEKCSCGFDWTEWVYDQYA